MNLEYRFPHIEKFRTLRLLISNDTGRLTIRLKGRHAFWMRPILGMYFRAYNRLTPISLRDGANLYTLFLPPMPSPAHNRGLENLLRRYLFGVRIPLAVTIAVTNRCQCRCQHCSLPEADTGKEEMSIEEIKRVTRESLELGVINITFTGGEPLLRRDLEQAIRIIPLDQAVSLLFTNGVGLTADRLHSLREAGLRGVQISLDSPDPSEHDTLRATPGLFNRVRDAVQAAKEEGMLVGLSTYASNQFVEGGKLAGIAALGEAWGVHEITVFDAIATGRFLHRGDVMLTPANRRRLIAEGIRLRQCYAGRLHIITQSWTNSNRGFARLIGCLAGHWQFHISATGHLRPCDFTPLSFGSIRQESVAALWKKLTDHPAYHRHSSTCRMQSPAFRRTYLSGGSAMP